MALLLYSEHNKSLANERSPRMDEKYSLNTEEESIYNTWANNYAIYFSSISYLILASHFAEKSIPL